MIFVRLRVFVSSWFWTRDSARAVWPRLPFAAPVDRIGWGTCELAPEPRSHEAERRSPRSFWGRPEGLRYGEAPGKLETRFVEKW